MADSDPQEEPEKTTEEGSRERGHEGNPVSVPTETLLSNGNDERRQQKTAEPTLRHTWQRRSDDANAKLENLNLRPQKISPGDPKKPKSNKLLDLIFSILLALNTLTNGSPGFVTNPSI